MWLVLCDTHDISALWLYRELQKLGSAPLELISFDVLLHSMRWHHRLGGDQNLFIAFELGDGRTFSSDTISGVINRLSGISPHAFPYIAESERQYAVQELSAFFVSWLHGIPAAVINRPSAQSLCGAWFHASEWTLMALRANLPTMPYRQMSSMCPPEYYLGGRVVPYHAPTTTVFVVGDSVIGTHIPESIADGCITLAKLANATLLGVEFVVSTGNEWAFAGVKALPDLRIGGLPLVHALDQQMQLLNVRVS